MVGFVWFVVGLSLSSSPPSDCISLPSMMTWASCPHGVRTRGKKKRAQTLAAMLFFCEFRPIDSQQSSSHLFHPSTEERLQDGGDSALGCGWLLVFVGWVVFVPSFNDDLGTMPTRRPYSWKKKRTHPQAKFRSRLGRSMHLSPQPPRS